MNSTIQKITLLYLKYNTNNDNNNNSKNVLVGDISLDVINSESYKMGIKVPTYTVENGYTLSDSIIREADTLTLTGVVTNASFLEYETLTGTERLKEIKNTFEDLLNQMVPITVVTGLGVFVDYAITSLEFSRNGEDLGSTLTIDIELQKIRIAKTQVTETPEFLVKTEKPTTKTSKPIRGTGPNGRAGITKKDAGKKIARPVPKPTKIPKTVKKSKLAKKIDDIFG